MTLLTCTNVCIYCIYILENFSRNRFSQLYTVVLLHSVVVYLPHNILKPSVKQSVSQTISPVQWCWWWPLPWAVLSPHWGDLRRMLSSEEWLHSVRGNEESHQHDVKQKIVDVLLLCYLPVCPRLLVDKLLVCHVHGSLPPEFVAIYCLTNGRYPNLGEIRHSAVLYKHFSDGGITTQSYTPTS